MKINKVLFAAVAAVACAGAAMARPCGPRGGFHGGFHGGVVHHGGYHHHGGWGRGWGWGLGGFAAGYATASLWNRGYYSPYYYGSPYYAAPTYVAPAVQTVVTPPVTYATPAVQTVVAPATYAAPVVYRSW